MIRIGILGYGNLGRGVEYAVEANEDMELVAVFTRRAPASVKPRMNVPVVSVDDAEMWKNKIDVLILCGGSATDLPEQTPAFAKLFNVVDSFDTHAKIPAHFAAVDAAAKETGHVGVISVGWDPGMFSLARSRTARTTRSGDAASARGIRMRFAAFRASRMPSSTPFPSRLHLRRCAAA